MKCEVCHGAEATYTSALIGGASICFDCFEGWYEWGITRPAAIKMRTDLHRAGTPSEQITETLIATFKADYQSASQPST